MSVHPPHCRPSMAPCSSPRYQTYDGVQAGGAETLPAPAGNTVTSGVEIDKGGDNATEWTVRAPVSVSCDAWKLLLSRGLTHVSRSNTSATTEEDLLLRNMLSMRGREDGPFGGRSGRPLVGL